MANYKGHIVGGVAAGTVLTLALVYVPIAQFTEAVGVLQSWQATAAVFIIAMLFGLFPDVDTNSKAQDIFVGTALIIDILLLLNGQFQAAAYLGFIVMLPTVSHHRGWTHSKWAMVLVPLPIILVPYLANHAVLPAAVVYYAAAVAGYFSHLLLDGLIWKRFRIKN